MANINLDPTNNYVFSRIQENTVITDSSNHSHAVKHFGNGVKISGSNVPLDSLHVFTPNNGRVTIQRNVGVGSTPMLSLFNSVNTGHCSMKFQGDNTFTLGVYNDTTSGNRDFQIIDSNTLVTSPRTNSFVGLVISPAREIFFPNIDDDAGDHPVRYNTTTREITYNSSTQRSKKDIVNAPSLLFDKVLHLPLRQFKKRNIKSNETIYTGFIAEEAAAVDPVFATYGADYEYDEFGTRGKLLSDEKVPVNIDLTAIVTALIGKVKQLESRIYQLENK